MEDKLRRIPLSVEPHLVGISSQTRDIYLWLQDGSKNVDVLLLHGIRGIGKSTIAKFVYNLNYKRFERCSYLENVREVSEQPNGLLRLQNQLLNDILSGSKVKVHSISEGMTTIEDAVGSKRVFLVLDDVDHVDQLDALLRMKKQFHPGSKIIITSSCAGLLEAHCQFAKVHMVRIMDENEALELFSWHAFGQDHPIEGYADHSRRVIHHCGGLPLALKVLAASLSGKNLVVWESALNKLEVIPNDEIMKKLKISYESIQDDHDKNLFLHIACFFIGMEKAVVLTILDACDFFTEVGIQNLIDRCLVTIDKDTKLLQMHDIIRDVGREIVRLESKEPEKRSRVWHHIHSFEVLSRNIGTHTIEGLVLNMQMHPASSNSSMVVLETNAFTRMHRLRLLQLSHVQLRGRYKAFPARLRWFCWIKFPLASLPTDFPLDSLVALEMCYSSLRQLWRGIQYFPALKILNLSHSHDLTEFPDFSSVPNLERLVFEDCIRLINVHENIGLLKKLIYLSVKDCKNLRNLPKNIAILPFLETLIISGCSNLREFPTEIVKIQSLKVFQADEVPIRQLLVNTSCSGPIPVFCWSSYLPRNLVNLSLRYCNLLDDNFPTDVAHLSTLQSLDLSGNPISGLPDCIRGLTGLQYLLLDSCTKLKSLLRVPPGVVDLSVPWCTSLEKLTFQSWGRYPRLTWHSMPLVEYQGRWKLEPIERVNIEMLKLLSLEKLESLENVLMDTVIFPYDKTYVFKGIQPVQGLYQNGIFSTFLSGDQVPGHFRHRSGGSSVTFTVPSLPNLNVRGLNIFSVVSTANNNDSDLMMSTVVNIDGSYHPTVTVVSNNSSGLKWIFGPMYSGVPREGKDVIWLSHWMFENRVKGGDEMTILIYTKSDFKVKECGIQLVYYDEKDQEEITSTEFAAANAGDLGFRQAGLSSTLGSYPVEGITFACDTRGIEDNIDLIRDINERTEKKQGQEGDLILKHAAQSGSNNSSNKQGFFRGWKGIMMAAVLLLSIPLVARSSLFQHRKKQQSTSPLKVLEGGE